MTPQAGNPAAAAEAVGQPVTVRNTSSESYFSDSRLLDQPVSMSAIFGVLDTAASKLVSNPKHPVLTLSLA